MPGLKQLSAPMLLTLLCAAKGSMSSQTAAPQQRSLIQPTIAHTAEPEYSHCGPLKRGRVVTRVGLSVTAEGLPDNLT